MSVLRQAVSPIEAANMAGVRDFLHPVFMFMSAPPAIRDWMVNGDPDLTARCRAEKPSESSSFTSLLTCLKMRKKIFTDREAREIMYLVASVRPSVHQSTLSQLNRLTYDIDLW